MTQSIPAGMGGSPHTLTSASPVLSTAVSQHSVGAEAVQIPQLAISLLDVEFPIFEEATQTASRFLDIPICIVGIPHDNALVLKAAIGLSQLGLMNPLARTRRLPLEDELARQVLQEKRRLVLPKIADHELFSNAFLVQEYGIQAYLGVPLLTAEGNCIGVLAAMDIAPHDFPMEAVAFMELLARWSVSEYERHHLSQKLTESASGPISAPKTRVAGEPTLLDTVRLTLMSQLTQGMRTPLTTITGMTSMLSREIYGTLTTKQREYTEIVHSSSQVLLEMANEVLELSSLGTSLQPLNPASVDFEMLGQHVQRTLTPVAKENNQEIRLTVEPGSRIWTLDKDIVRQLLYHLTFTLIKLSGEGGTIRIHGSERHHQLNIAVWVSHPWLGEGLPNSVLALRQFLKDSGEETNILSVLLTQAIGQAAPKPLESSLTESKDSQAQAILKSRETLSLLLSRHLIERHGGSLTLQGNPESGYRFLVILPST
ncbi:MAG: GAF domain-containing sensor histidine kinase [Leptolyngbya sp. SIO1E4]|nr:GAF domain-containing sensor histidine kinase [Leptolyngbya sp. SIO1E4]